MEIQTKFETLIAKITSSGEKYALIFELKHLEASSELMQAFTHLNDSALLQHELAYALGQMPYSSAIEEFLKSVITDEQQAPVVRHEAAEGLANFGKK